MSHKIEYISTFYADVLNVAEFLAEYPDKASRIFAKIDKALQNLREMPEMYAVYPEIPSFRFIVTEDCLVFYKFKKPGGIVEVHRLIHGRMDIPAHIRTGRPPYCNNSG
ncbi:MAG: type II toxin-antitoxin system RelE/ParE family toxin [Clostridiales Family XIII bacterium]|nr:type II toxin-antitoxin system RelE/ParE family toxin [Clostridiales Family XIII bacterium]